MLCFELIICYFANYSPSPIPHSPGYPPFGFPPTYSKTIEKKQQTPQNKGVFPKTCKNHTEKKNKQTNTKISKTIGVNPRGSAWNSIMS